MGVRERYEQRQKEGKDKEVYSGVKQRYMVKEIEGVASSITNRVNTWLKNHNTYISNYQKRNAGRKYGYEDSYVSDSADWLNTVTQQKSNFDKEADSILSYLDQYKGYLDEKWVNSIKKTLADARSQQGLILDYTTKDNDWWNSFANEELVKQYGSAENAYKTYQRYDGYSKKYEGQTSDDLAKILESMEDGEEKDWLSSHRASVYHDEMLKYDTETAGKELAVLENVLGEYDRLEDYYNKYSANPNAYSGDDSARIRELASIFAQYKQKFGSKKDLEKLVQKTKRNLEYAKKNQAIASMSAVTGNEDFGDKSQYVSNVEYGHFGKPTFTDNTYAYVNNPVVEDKRPLGGGDASARELIDWEHSAYSWDTPTRNRDSSYEREALEHIKPEEVAIYNYYYATQGPEKAREYLDLLIDTFQDRKNVDTAQKVSQFASEHPWISSAMSVGTSLGSGFEYIGDIIEYGGDKILGKDAQMGTNESALITNAIRGTVSENVNWEIGNWDAFDFVYNTVMSGADSLASTAFGGLGGTVLGLSAAAQGTNDALDRGMSSDQAFWNGIFSGAFEGLFETISIGQFNALKEVAPKSIKDIFKNLGKSMLVNASEETLTEIANIGYDTLVNGEFANYTLEELENGAWKQALQQVLESGASGALMGVGMGGISTGLGFAEGKDGKGGKALSGYQIRKLVSANESQFAVENYNDAVSAAEKRLTELGESKDVAELAKLVAKKATGQELTRKEKSTLVNSQFGSKVAKEMTTAAEQTYKPLEERVGTDSRFNVSDTGKTVIRESGTEIDIGSLEVATVGDGQVTFKMDDGTEVSAGDIDFADEDQSYLASAVSSIENITPAAATTIMHDLVDTSKPLGEQLNGMDEAYNYGFHGYSVADLKAGNYAPSLTNTQMMSAYELGKSARKISDTASDAPRVRMRTEAQAKLTKKQKTEQQKARIESDDVEVYFQNGKSVVKFDEHTGKYDDKRMAAVNTAKFLSKLGIGSKYIFYESYAKGNKRVYRDSDGNEVDAPNGMYMEDGTIWIDLNAGENGQGTALFTMGHELTHFIKAQSSKQFKVLCDLVKEAFDKTDMSMHERVLAKQKFLEGIRGKDVSYNEAYEEVVADAMSTMLTDGSFHEKIMEIKVKDKGLFNTIKRFFEQMIAKFRKAYAELTPDQQDARDIRAMKDMFDKIQTAFAEALVEASDNFQAVEAQKNTTEDGGVAEAKESIRRTQKMTLKDQLSDYYKGKFKRSDAFYFGITPSILSRSGLDAHPLAFAQDDFLKSTSKKHNIPRRVLTKLSANLASPIFSFTAGKQAAIVIKDIDGDGKPVVVAIHGGHNMDRKPVNSIKSIYGIDSLGEWVSQQIDGGCKFRVYDIEKANAMLQTEGYLAEVGTQSDGSWDKITKNKPSVNSESSEEVGLDVDAKTESVAPKVLKSERTWTSSEYVQERDKAAKENAEAYLEMCARNNKRPKFYKLLQNNGDGSYSLKADGSTDGYWKLLIDFKMYDNEGNGSPQMAVKPEFNMEEANRMLETYKGGHSNFPVAQGIVDGFVKEYKSSHKGQKFSERGDVTSNRSLLADAFEGIAKDSDEYKLVKRYKGYVAELDSLEERLGELNAEIRATDDAEKRSRLEDEAEKIAESINKYDKKLLSLEASEPLRKIIERERNAERQKAKENAQKLKADYKLRNEVKQSEILREVRETRAALRNQKNDAAVMEKEFIRIAKAYERLDAKAETRAGKDARTIANLKDALKDEAKKHREDQKTWEAEFNRLMREYEAAGRSIDKLEAKIERQKANARAKIESRERTELRHKIRKAVRDLDKILNRGNKKSNVKEGMKDFVAQALASAEVLFMDNYSNEDMVRNGVEVKVDANENRLLDETQRLLRQRDDLYSVGAIRGEIDDVIVGDTSGFEDRMAESERLDRKISKNMALLRSVFERERARINETTVSSVLDDLAKAYRKLGTSDDLYIRNVTDENVYQHLLSLSERMEGAIVKDMKLSQLEELYKAYKMVLHTVRNANNLFVKGKMESIDKMAEKITSDFNSRKIPDKTMAIVARNLSNKLGWDYEKLYYALDRIGSEAFTELVMNIANSENIVMQDVMEATAFRDQMVEKYGFNDWAVNKTIDREFLDNTGKKFKLTLGQLMSLYAYSRREGAWDHIEYGGFSFKDTPITENNSAASYKLNKAQVEAITGLLTAEQKAYVEEMQKFLSETMGAKGNEVTMQLYGVELFKEKNYFPIHIDGRFMANAQESQAKEAAGFSSMTSAGFTHAQNPQAKAPFMMEGFMETWADHVNEMSRYHGTVPALEDFRKVMNRSTYSDSESDSMSVRTTMENAFGKKAVQYFDNLYKEANSGAVRDKLGASQQKLLSLFRKNSVAYSLSVLIQQPASMVRAYAMIDRKYFGRHGFGALTSGIAKAVSNKWTKAHTNAYNEMLKYAPGVVLAKDIGGFDTATGGSIRSHLLDTGKSLKQSWNTEDALGKGKAVLDKVDDNHIANLPNVADKIAWVEIWEACKRETLSKHTDLAPTSEEFLQIAGDRFTEVIRATQVYDSIFAKSPMLKSKHMGVQMLVSFMNEPNTVANMVEGAIRDVTRGNTGKAMRTAAVVVHSVIFTNVLKSIIYAMRDDDEDETYIEKYVESFVGNLMSDFNPFSYIPVLRDISSLAQGYDVERADMAIIADLLDAIEKVSKYKNTDTDGMTEEQMIELEKKVDDANWRLVESVAAFFGIPVKNIRREVNAIFDHFRIASANAGQTTAQSAWDTIYDAVIDSMPDFLALKKATKGDKLYRAIVNGDKEYLARMQSTYVDKHGNYDESKYDAAVVKALREGDPRIREAAQAGVDGNSEERNRIYREIKAELGAEYANWIIKAINSEANEIINDSKPEKIDGQYEAYDFVEAVTVGDTEKAKDAREDIISTYLKNGKTETEAEKAFMSDVNSAVEQAYSYEAISKAEAENLLMDYVDMDEEEAADRVTYWDFCKANPNCDLSESRVLKYLEYAEPAEISLEVYEQFVTDTKDLADIEDEWGDVEVSKRDQVLEVIDSLPLTWQQKDALYLAAGYAESKIWDVPW